MTSLLIIGGSQFVGRHLIETALAQGYDVTMFNRGKTNPGLYPDVEEIHGDRDGELDNLKGRTWDVVVDTSGYVPRVVRQSAELLKDATGTYVFVSSISVYANEEAGELGEDNGTLHQLEDESVEEITGETYGGLKVLCENVVTDVYGDRGINVRAGFIVGRYDVAWRLPYLIHRYDRPGEKIAGRPEQIVQFIHATDMSNWMLDAAKNGISGAYNLTGTPLRMDALLHEIVKQTAKGATPVYVGDDVLQAHGIAPVDGLTYWVPQAYERLMDAPIQKALDTGLTETPLETIIADVLPWSRERTWDEAPERVKDIILTPEREAEVLASYHAEQSR